MQIFVKDCLDSTFTFEVEPSDKIISIKTKLRQTNGIQEGAQTLIYNGTELLHNTTISDYGIGEYTTIHLVVRLHGALQISVKYICGRMINLNVVSSETIRDVKEKIRVEDSGTPPLFRLIFAGKHLEEDDRTLADYNVQNGSVLFLVARLRGGAN